ncbi:multicopper oxidase domain-containing protein [Bradyrhizobium sp. CW7]|uniref:multicopper oxidase family protein n=1 Tax=Bradyrhizobium sp. CW7 TaxID=2782688 RepID=UPI001FF8C07A|nr:multicopper oxidase domain-containing protein [Bradyrhizobium sp. CW7]MCK1351643.1 multicopper oxidase domain-containing protein [Bradyrhizobium sp. CW7]
MQRLNPWEARLPIRFGQAAWVTGVALGFLLQPAIAAELVQPPICSEATAGQPDLAGICSITPLGIGQNEVKITLRAASAEIVMGGYKVTSGNYNYNYLTPIVEAMPGDTVSAHLINALTPSANGSMHDHNDGSTNLHYFHGGIVSPNNARPAPAELGTGDNVYVHLKSGLRFDYKVPIPGKTPIPGNDMIDARVLESTGLIPHPLGLNWYHSHLHGTSSDQVMGGMSGLLSVGEATANVKAGCLPDPNDKEKCSNDIAKDTSDLKRITMVRYALLRDMPVMNIAKLPGEANGDAATWDPDPAARDFTPGKPCGVWKPDGSGPDLDPKLRTGFCQREQKKALLFTVNGQRYPTITVEGGKNLLLRLGNLSANIPYWLELRNEDATDTKPLRMTILSLDGVVPAIPIAPGQAQKPVQAVDYDDVLMMPATRAEIYVRNDDKHERQRVYILKTKQHTVEAGTDEWPEIQLARIVLEPNATTSNVRIALNAAVATPGPPQTPSAALAIETTELPPGCIRDLAPAFREYRRVMFLDGVTTSNGKMTDWSVFTQIIRPTGPDPQDEPMHNPPPDEDPDKNTVGLNGGGIPFEEYVGSDELVDWTKKHVCVFIDKKAHAGSHKQLWVLTNATGTLHNFHIHQMKFRLATGNELNSYFIKPPASARTCGQGACPANTPNYDLYDDQQNSDLDRGATRRWHDTIPLPPGQSVFVVMSFDTSQQLGRFVFHCHILKHEDKGLMAPIEVWGPGLAAQ